MGWWFLKTTVLCFLGATPERVQMSVSCSCHDSVFHREEKKKNSPDEVSTKRSEKAVRKLQRKPVLFWNLFLKISFIIRQFVPLEQNIKKNKFCLYSPPQYFIGNADQIIKTFSLDLKSWESTLLTV